MVSRLVNAPLAPLLQAPPVAVKERSDLPSRMPESTASLRDLVTLTGPSPTSASSPSTVAGPGVTPPPDNPWPEMLAAGLLAAAPGTSPPLAQALSASGLAAVTAMMARLEGAGIEFAVPERDWLGRPRLGTQKPVDARTATALLESGAPPGEVLLQEPQQSKDWRRANLLELQALDLCYGIGPDAVPDRREVAEAFLSLQDHGIRFDYGGGGKPGGGEYSPRAWLNFSRGSGVEVRKSPRQLYVWKMTSDEEMLGLDFFEGSRQDHGIRDLDFATAARQLDADGLEFYREGHGYRTGFGAWREFAHDTFLVGHRGRAAGADMWVRVSARNLQDVGRLEAWVTQVEATANAHRAELEDGWTRDALPVLHALGFWGSSVDSLKMEFERAVIGMGGPLDVPTRSVVLAGLWGAVFSRVPDPVPHMIVSGSPGDLTPPGEALGRAIEDFRVLGKDAPEHARFLRAAGDYVRCMREARVGLSRPAQLLHRDRVLAAAVKHPATAADDERVLRLVPLAGSLQGAAEAWRLVEAAPEGASRDERMAVVTTLLERETPEGRKRVAEDFRIVEEHCLPGQSLTEAARHLADLLGLLAGRKEADRAAEVFVRLQDDLRAGLFGDACADQVYAKFGTQYLLARHEGPPGSVDQALRKVFEPDAVRPGTGMVEQDDSSVVVGGVRVPKRPGNGVSASR